MKRKHNNMNVYTTFIERGAAAAVLLWAASSQTASAICFDLREQERNCSRMYWRPGFGLENYHQHCDEIVQAIKECEAQEKMKMEEEKAEGIRQMMAMSMGELERLCQNDHLKAQGQCSVVDRNSMVSMGLCIGLQNAAQECWYIYNQRRAAGE